jgi:predicted AlkP superfamily pyrophosphatase or phosphodiesterase
MRPLIFSLLIPFLLFSCSESTEEGSNSIVKPTPKLVVQITIDQLRGDLPTMYNYDEGGFKMFNKSGFVFSNAQYDHATTVTAVGHATLATGASPKHHGIIGNGWVDTKTNNFIYNSQDSNYHLLDSNSTLRGGTSSKFLTQSTFSEELKKAHPKSKVYGISGKDRGAIFLAGKQGKAIWYDSSTGKMNSSNYFYESTPEWLNNFNETKGSFLYKDSIWNLFNDESSYVCEDNREYEKEVYLGKTLPKDLSTLDENDFYKEFGVTPYSDDLLSSLAKELIIENDLGGDEVTDYLSISYSATDKIGHVYGPRSREQEDNLHRLNSNLGDLIIFLDKKIGIDNVLLVLCADHGVAEIAETKGKKRLVLNELIDSINKEYNLENGSQINPILGYVSPYMYLDMDNIEKHNLDINELEKSLADRFEKVDGIQKAYAVSDLLEGKYLYTEMERKISNSVSEIRGGQVYIVPEEYYFISGGKAESTACTHGTPHRYDTWVPIYFLGFNVNNGFSNDIVHPKDIAGTLSDLIGVSKPSASYSSLVDKLLLRYD